MNISAASTVNKARGVCVCVCVLSVAGKHAALRRSRMRGAAACGVDQGMRRSSTVVRRALCDFPGHSLPGNVINLDGSAPLCPVPAAMLMIT